VKLKTINCLRVAGALFASAMVLTGCGNTDDVVGTASGGTTTIVDPATGETVEVPTSEVNPSEVFTGGTEEDNAALAAINVTGPVGAEPVVEFTTPFSVTTHTSRLVSDGDGAALHDGQFVAINAAMWRADNGEKVLSTWADGYPESFILGGGQFTMLATLLQGQHVGARVLIANPTTLPTGESTTVLTIFEVESAVDIPTRATGAAVDYDSDAVGVLVTLADNGAPSIEIADGFTPSSDLVVQTLIEGTGPEVTPDQTLGVHYTGWLTNGEQFDSSWARDEPAVFPLTGVIAGWTQGLAGQRVGSQVLLIIPPELGYGDRAAGSIPPNSTLIFVVDILYAE